MNEQQIAKLISEIDTNNELPEGVDPEIMFRTLNFIVNNCGEEIKALAGSQYFPDSMRSGMMGSAIACLIMLAERLIIGKKNKVLFFSTLHASIKNLADKLDD